MTKLLPVTFRPVILWLVLAGLGLAAPVSAALRQVGHVQVDLISESQSIQAGKPFMVGLHLVMDDHWHVYWRNAGDAGLPPTLKWDLPDGFTAAEIQWPTPQRIELGTLVNYGYEGELLLPVTYHPTRQSCTGV